MCAVVWARGRQARLTTERLQDGVVAYPKRQVEATMEPKRRDGEGTFEMINGRQRRRQADRGKVRHVGEERVAASSKRSEEQASGGGGGAPALSAN